MHWITVGPATTPARPLHLPGGEPGITDDERGTIAEMMAKGSSSRTLAADGYEPSVGTRP
jgi:hypothetical protein